MRKRSRRSELKRFGVTLGIAFGALGGVFLLRGKSFYPYFLGLSAAFFLFGLLLPAALGPVQKLWMTLATALGWFMTRAILSVLFFAVVTPVGLIARLVGRDPLSLKFKDGADSYWIPKQKTTPKKSDYERQF